MTETPKCVKCHGNYLCEYHRVPATPPRASGALDWEAAERDLVGRTFSMGTHPTYNEALRERLQAQHRALLAAAVAEEREKREVEEMKSGVRGKMLKYIAFVLTGDENGDAQLAADRLAPLLAAHREWVEARKAFASFPETATGNDAQEFQDAYLRRCEAESALAAVSVGEGDK